MTLEINRGKSPKKFRINPDDPCVVDWRYNRHGARWQTHSRYASKQAARRALLAQVHVDGEGSDA